MARSWTFSPSNALAEYGHYEGARGNLVDLARAAYEQGNIGPYNVRRITGLHREEVAPLPPGWTRSVAPTAARCLCWDRLLR